MKYGSKSSLTVANGSHSHEGRRLRRRYIHRNENLAASSGVRAGMKVAWHVGGIGDFGGEASALRRRYIIIENSVVNMTLR